jgi:hypothetical protein
VDVVYGLGLAIALLVGGAIGWFVRAESYEQARAERWADELALAYRREREALGRTPDHAPDDEMLVG